MLPNSSGHGAIVRLLSRRALTLAELAQATGVSLPTLRRAIQDLSEKRWVAPNGEHTTTGGRPAVLYGLDATHHYIFGVHIQLPGLRIAAVDLAGDVLCAKHIAHDELRPDDVVREVAHAIQAIIARFPQRNPLGLSVATPGFTDPDSGTILSIGRVPGWQNYPLKARLEAGVGLRVSVANDVDCMAIAELAHLGAWPTANIVYLGFDEGIKVSLFLEGRQYTGPFGNAGNVGNSVLPVFPATNGPEVAKLEHLVSLRAISETFDAWAAQQDAPPAEHNLAPRQIDDHRAKFRALVQAATAGDALCRTLLEEGLDTLAIAIANLLHILQPGMLITGGALSDLAPDLHQHFDAAVRRHLPPLISNYLVIQKAQFALPNQVCIGAARAFLDRCVLADDFLTTVGERAR